MLWLLIELYDTLLWESIFYKYEKTVRSETMKKITLLTMMTVILLILVSCNTSNETASNASVLNSVTNDIEDSHSTNDLLSDEVIETDSVSEEVSEAKSSDTTEDTYSEEILKKTRITDSIETKDSVVYELENAYYNEDGGIVVEGYIVNVTDYEAGIVRCRELQLFDENNELIASDSFGYVKEFYGCISIDVGDKFEKSFTFPSISVYIKDVDLDTVKVVSSFTSKHNE